VLTVHRVIASYVTLLGQALTENNTNNILELDLSDTPLSSQAMSALSLSFITKVGINNDHVVLSVACAVPDSHDSHDHDSSELVESRKHPCAP